MSSNFMHSCNEFEMQRVEITDSLSNGLLATLALSVTIFFGCFIIFLIVRRFREDDLKYNLVYRESLSISDTVYTGSETPWMESNFKWYERLFMDDSNFDSADVQAFLLFLRFGFKLMFFLNIVALGICLPVYLFGEIESKKVKVKIPTTSGDDSNGVEHIRAVLVFVESWIVRASAVRLPKGDFRIWVVIGASWFYALVAWVAGGRFLKNLNSLPLQRRFAPSKYAVAIRGIPPSITSASEIASILDEDARQRHLLSVALIPLCGQLLETQIKLAIKKKALDKVRIAHFRLHDSISMYGGRSKSPSTFFLTSGNGLQHSFGVAEDINNISPSKTTQNQQQSFISRLFPSRNITSNGLREPLLLPAPGVPTMDYHSLNSKDVEGDHSSYLSKEAARLSRQIFELELLEKSIVESGFDSNCGIAFMTFDDAIVTRQVINHHRIAPQFGGNAAASFPADAPTVSEGRSPLPPVFRGLFSSKGLQITSAPPPEDILWPNIHLPSITCRLLETFSWLSVALLVFAILSPVSIANWLIVLVKMAASSSSEEGNGNDDPTSRSSSSTNEENTSLFNWSSHFSSSYIIQFLESTIPPLLLLLFNSVVLPSLVFWHAEFSRPWRRSRLLMLVMRGNVLFLIFNILIVPLFHFKSLSQVLDSILASVHASKSQTSISNLYPIDGSAASVDPPSESNDDIAFLYNYVVDPIQRVAHSLFSYSNFDSFMIPSTNLNSDTGIMPNTFPSNITNEEVTSSSTTLTEAIPSVVVESLQPLTTIASEANQSFASAFVTTSGIFFLKYLISASFISPSLHLSGISQFATQLWDNFMSDRSAISKSSSKRGLNSFKKRPPFNFGLWYACHVATVCIALATAPLFPLVIPLTTLYFGLRYLTDKYNFLFDIWDPTPPVMPCPLHGFHEVGDSSDDEEEDDEEMFAALGHLNLKSSGNEKRTSKDIPSFTAACTCHHATSKLGMRSALHPINLNSKSHHVGITSNNNNNITNNNGLHFELSPKTTPVNDPINLASNTTYKGGAYQHQPRVPLRQDQRHHVLSNRIGRGDASFVVTHEAFRLIRVLTSLGLFVTSGFFILKGTKIQRIAGFVTSLLALSMVFVRVAGGVLNFLSATVGYIIWLRDWSSIAVSNRSTHENNGNHERSPAGDATAEINHEKTNNDVILVNNSDSIFNMTNNEDDLMLPGIMNPQSSISLRILNHNTANNTDDNFISNLPSLTLSLPPQEQSKSHQTFNFMNHTDEILLNRNLKLSRGQHAPNPSVNVKYNNNTGNRHLNDFKAKSNNADTKTVPILNLPSPTTVALCDPAFHLNGWSFQDSMQRRGEIAANNRNWMVQTVSVASPPLSPAAMPQNINNNHQELIIPGSAKARSSIASKNDVSRVVRDYFGEADVPLAVPDGDEIGLSSSRELAMEDPLLPIESWNTSGEERAMARWDAFDEVGEEGEGGGGDEDVRDVPDGASDEERLNRYALQHEHRQQFPVKKKFVTRLDSPSSPVWRRHQHESINYQLAASSHHSNSIARHQPKLALHPLRIALLETAYIPPVFSPDTVLSASLFSFSPLQAQQWVFLPRLAMPSSIFFQGWTRVKNWRLNDLPANSNAATHHAVHNPSPHASLFPPFSHKISNSKHDVPHGSVSNAQSASSQIVNFARGDSVQGSRESSSKNKESGLFASTFNSPLMQMVAKSTLLSNSYLEGNSMSIFTHIDRKSTAEDNSIVSGNSKNIMSSNYPVYGKNDATKNFMMNNPVHIKDVHVAPSRKLKQNNKDESANGINF